MEYITPDEACITERIRKGETASGYGGALPTPYMVRVGSRWYRVKVMCYANSGTAYITRGGAVQAIDEHALEDALRQEG